MMKINSYESVGGIPFGADRSALAALGDPLRERRSRLGDDEMVFATATYRFAEGKFVEVTFSLPTEVELNGLKVAGEALIAHLKEHDPDYREESGFAVSPTLGLAVDLDDDHHWTTVFVAGRWDS